MEIPENLKLIKNGLYIAPDNSVWHDRGHPHGFTKLIAIDSINVDELVDHLGLRPKAIAGYNPRLAVMPAYYNSIQTTRLDNPYNFPSGFSIEDLEISITGVNGPWFKPSYIKDSLSTQGHIYLPNIDIPANTLLVRTAIVPNKIKVTGQIATIPTAFTKKTFATAFGFDTTMLPTGSNGNSSFYLAFNRAIDIRPENISPSDFTMTGATIQSVNVDMNNYVSPNGVLRLRVYVNTLFVTGQTVTISHTGNKIKDLEGNVFNFTNQPVTIT